MSRELIQRGLSNPAVLSQVQQQFPGCDTTLECIAWYRSQLKRTASAAPSAPIRPGASSSWPEWDLPSDQGLLLLARLTTPYIRFLNPEIVRVVVEDNEQNGPGWSRELIARGIEPSDYLWPRSACVFPGVRRYAGSAEIAQFNRRSQTPAAPRNALALDDNSYPKEIWSFILRGKKFANTGPTGYSLAHIADHKNYKDRGREEFDMSGAVAWRTLPGLYTCVTNTVFIAEGLIRPTDFAFPLRNLLQRKAVALYGEFCNLMPPHLSVRPSVAPEWSLDAFEWRPPVGSVEPVATFLAHRAMKMRELLSAPPGI